MKNNMMLLCDFYKIAHKRMYPANMTKLYSTWTPRSNDYFPEADYVVWYGLQGFIKEYLIGYFQTYFFNRDIDEVVEEYKLYIHNTFDETAETDHIVELHKLGYIPIKIKALPEGTKVPIRVPCMTVENTDSRFAWITNYLETLFSCNLWLPTTSATTAYVYRQILEKYITFTSDNPVWKRVGAGDFSFRGMASLDSAITSGSAFLTSFTKTSTIPSIQYLSEYYNADVTKEEVGSWSASVEHSCTTSNFAIDGDEDTFFVKMITELYPDKPFSFVADSYDYYGFLDRLKNHKDLILSHKGTIRIRPDSGDPETIICGKSCPSNIPYEIKVDEEKGTLNILWDIFGGTINSKGYRVLNPCIGIVYGDAITLDRCESICQRMMEMGYSVENVVFGVGSYSMQYRTRDSFGFAYKATYAEIDGKPIMVYKDPKTDKGTKKSQKGMVKVFRDYDGEIKYEDGHFDGEFTTANVKPSDINLLETVFLNGKLIKEQSLKEIRDRLHADNGGF